MTTEKPKHGGARANSGGAREGAGRKTPDGSTLETTFLVKLSNNQKAKVLRLGGGSWVRTQINDAREPGESPPEPTTGKETKRAAFLVKLAARNK